MSAPTTDLRPVVHRCLSVAATSALAGDRDRAHHMIGLALELATQGEARTILMAADRLLGGYTPTVRAAPPAPPAPAGRSVAEGSVEDVGAEAAPQEEGSPDGTDAMQQAADPRAEEAPPPPPTPRAPSPPRPRPRRRRSRAAGAMGVPMMIALVAGALLWGATSWMMSDPVDLAGVEQAINRGDARRALTELDGVDPDEPQVHLLRGRALLQLGDTTGARQALASAQRLGGNGAAGRRAAQILQRLPRDAAARPR